MKRLLIVLLIALISVGCSNKNSQQSSQTTPESSQTSEKNLSTLSFPACSVWYMNVLFFFSLYLTKEMPSLLLLKRRHITLCYCHFYSSFKESFTPAVTATTAATTTTTAITTIPITPAIIAICKHHLPVFITITNSIIESIFSVKIKYTPFTPYKECLVDTQKVFP